MTTHTLEPLGALPPIRLEVPSVQKLVYASIGAASEILAWAGGRLLSPFAIDLTRLPWDDDDLDL